MSGTSYILGSPGTVVTYEDTTARQVAAQALTVATNAAATTSANSPFCSVVSGEPLKLGQPVYVHPVTRKLMRASAALLSSALMVGLVLGTVGEGVSISVASRLISCDDWTDVVGAHDLAPGHRYFLSVDVGQLCLLPPLTSGSALVSVGLSICPRYLQLQISDPILL